MARSLSSPDNPLVKHLRSLHERAAREESGLMLLEGPHLLAEALAAGIMPEHVVFQQSWPLTSEGSALLSRAEAGGAVLLEATEKILAGISTTATAPPVIAAVPIPRPDGGGSTQPGLVVDGLQDPGNLGTIIRTAWGAGAGTIFTTKGTVDLYAPKVLRAAQGAHFHLLLRELDRDELLHLIQSEGWRLTVAEPMAPVPFWQAELREPCLIGIGGEARGLGADIIGAALERVSIPLAPGVDSLNAGISAAVLLFELVRRRRA